MELVIVGPPGSGKSVVGRQLARARGAAFVDLDAAVEKAAGMTVARVFETEGEAGFRARESAAIVALGRPDASARLTRVVATGGGAVLDPRNRWRLFVGRRTVTLDVRPELLGQRLARSPVARPLIVGREPGTAVRDLLAARRRYYAAATPIDGHGRVEDVGGRLAAMLDRPAPDGTRLLLAETPIGRLDLGYGHADRALVGALAELRARRATIASEPGAWSQHGERLAVAVTAAGVEAVPLMLPRGEHAKTLPAWERALRELAKRRMERRDPIVALGGGALGDAAGFLAATWLRGVPWVTVPTTLLAQIDAAIGGKTGLDLPEGKNLVGALHQPATIVLDIALLATLPTRQRRTALGEAVKYAALGDERLFSLLEEEGLALAAGDPAAVASGALAELVERCAMAKVEVVSADERESGERIQLNLGHSLGHAIEAVAGFRGVLHGEAVALGLRGAVAIGRAMGVTPAERGERIVALLDGLGLAAPAPPTVTAAAIRAALGADKKMSGGWLRWVLPTAHGVVVRDDVPDTAVEAGIAVALSGGRRRRAAA
ncbi:MAG: bifunctional shikimate kinase/3-dehydroquinate synthase [Candidatus Limnocylindrales bacterium]